MYPVLPQVTSNSYFSDPYLYNCKYIPAQFAIYLAESRCAKTASHLSVQGLLSKPLSSCFSAYQIFICSRFLLPAARLLSCSSRCLAQVSHQWLISPKHPQHMLRQHSSTSHACAQGSGVRHKAGCYCNCCLGERQYRPGSSPQHRRHQPQQWDASRQEDYSGVLRVEDGPCLRPPAPLQTHKLSTCFIYDGDGSSRICTGF